MFGYQCHLASILAELFVTLQAKGIWQLKQQGAWQPLCSATGKAHWGACMHVRTAAAARLPICSTWVQSGSSSGRKHRCSLRAQQSPNWAAQRCRSSKGNYSPAVSHELLASGRLSSLSGALRLASAHWAVSSRSSSA